MAKMDPKRLAKTAAGVPAELMISIVRGSGTNAIALPGSAARDGLVAVVRDTSGSAWHDIVATAEIQPHGSMTPGTDVGSDDLWVTWYKFD